MFFSWYLVYSRYPCNLAKRCEKLLILVFAVGIEHSWFSRAVLTFKLKYDNMLCVTNSLLLTLIKFLSETVCSAE